MVERRVMVRWKIMGRRKDKGGGKSLHKWLTLGKAMERGGVEGWGLHPRLAWFYLTLSPPRPA